MHKNAARGDDIGREHRQSVVEWRRYLVFLLDGLRATDRPPLPGVAPSFASLDDVIAVGKPP
jgi:hypothetical protein